MAASNLKEYLLLGSPMVHTEMCKSHELPIDMVCEDCDEFICAKCAKTDHIDHDWKTIPTAATQRRRGLHKCLRKIKEEDLPGIDEKIEKMSKQITENKELCDSEIKKLQKHHDDVLARLTEIKKRIEKKLRDNLVKKNDQLNHVKVELDKKRRGIVDTVEFMEENNSTMSDYGLIKSHRELTKISELEVHTTNCEHSVRYTSGEINDKLFECLVGHALDFDDIGVTQINSFEYGDNAILVLETLSENQCYIREYESEYTGKVNKQGTKKHEFSITPTDMCVTGKGDVYFTDGSEKSISCLSPSGSVFTVVSTDPLEPGGICPSEDSGFLVTLTDNESGDYKLDSHRRRLVRHITVTGEVIHEYEYQEDSQTRLFTVPYRVTQNSNSDICVVNYTSLFTGDLI